MRMTVIQCSPRPDVWGVELGFEGHPHTKWFIEAKDFEGMKALNEAIEKHGKVNYRTK